MKVISSSVLKSQLFTLEITEKMVFQNLKLLNLFNVAEGPGLPVQFNATEAPKEPTCGETPARLCKSAFNTTAPMFGISLTSGEFNAQIKNQ